MTITTSTTAALTAAWDVDGPYSLRASVGPLPCGSLDPTVVVADGAVWLAFRNDDGAATLRLTQRGPLRSSSVHAMAWGPGASLALLSVPRLVGLQDDWTAFDAFGDSLPELARKGRYLSPGVRLPATGRMLDSVVRVILEQKVTGLEAKRAWRYLVSRFGSPAPVAPGAPALLLPPTPEQWRRVPSWEWHRAGVDSKRSAAALRAAGVATSLERLASLDAAGVRAGLRSIPGIGEWTVAEVLQRTHGCPDSISVGDYHLAAFVGAALTGQRTDDAGMLKLLAPWAGQRQRVVRMLYASGFRKQAYGPRLSPEDNRRR